MIHINLQLANPWSDLFKSGRFWSGRVTKNKYWEVQTQRTNDVLVFKLDVTTRRDHAGFNLELGLLSFNIAVNIYDHRHWDYSANAWL